VARTKYGEVSRVSFLRSQPSNCENDAFSVEVTLMSSAPMAFCRGS
jgi:hypothetical protein